MKISVPDLISKFLLDAEISDVFSVSGGYNILLLDSLKKHGIKLNFFHHQQALAMAAQGYYRMSGKIPLCLTTAGPGATNMITGVYGSWVDSLPMFIISGQCSINQIAHLSKHSCRQLGQQDSPILQIVEPITKYATTITDEKAIVTQLTKAYNIMNHDRKGPVWIDIPLNIQNVKVNTSELYTTFLEVQTHEDIPQQFISKFTKLLQTSKKPLIVVGNSIRTSNSYELLHEFLNKTNLPVVTGVHSGVDCIDNTYENYAGRIGMLGQNTSNDIVQQCDLLIVLGSRLTFKMTGYNELLFAPNAKKIIVDIDQNEIDKHSFTPDLKFVGNIYNVLNKLVLTEFQLDINDWLSHIKFVRSTQLFYLQKHKNIKQCVSLYYFTSILSNYTKDVPTITSNGSAHVVIMQMMKLQQKQRLFTNTGCVSMGYGLPSSIGACIANKQRTVCIEGDGSIMMNIQQLQTVVNYNLPLVIIVINNGGYLSIRMSQNAQCNSILINSNAPSEDLTLPSFQKMANAFGIKYYCITTNDQIDNTLMKVFNDELIPIFVQLICNPNQQHQPRVVPKGIDDNGNIIPGCLSNMYISQE